MRFLKRMSAFLALLTLVFCFTTPGLSASAASTTCSVKISVTQSQKDARDLLSSLNSFRTNASGGAWYWNSDNKTKTVFNTSGNTKLSTLKWDYALEKVAMQRAIEIAISFSHTRPNGESCFTAYPSGYSYKGENICAGSGNLSASGALKLWKEDNENYAGQGHRRNMLNKNFTAVGMAHVKYNGFDYWVQEFGNPCSSTASFSAANSTVTKSVSIAKSCLQDTYVKVNQGTSSYSMYVGDYKTMPPSNFSVKLNSKEHFGGGVYLVPTVTFSSSNPAVADVVGGKLKALGKGTAVITMKYTTVFGETLSCKKTVKVTVPSVSKMALKASSSSYSANKLSWSQISGVDGYLLYRATSQSGKYSKIAKLTGDSTLSYKDTDLTCGQTYYYKARAYIKAGDTYYYGSYSSIVSAKPSLKATVLTSVTAVDHTSVKLTWEKVSGATGYRIYRSTSATGTFEYIKAVKSSEGLTYTDIDLSCAKTYYYKVRAYRTVDGTNVYGKYSDVLSVKPKPKKVTLNSVAKASSGKINLAWTRIKGVTGYAIYRSTASDGTYECIGSVISSTSITYTDKSLKSGKTYYYKVRAFKQISGKKYYGSYSSIKYAKA